MYINESCRTRTVRIFVPLRSVLTEVQWTSSTPSRALLIYKRYPKRIPFVYKRVLPDSNGSRSPLCSGRCRTDIHRMSCTVSRSIRKRLESIYICKSPAGLERFVSSFHFGRCRIVFFSFIRDEGVAGAFFSVTSQHTGHWPGLF